MQVLQPIAKVAFFCKECEVYWDYTYPDALSCWNCGGEGTKQWLGFSSQGQMVTISQQWLEEHG